MMEQNTNPVLTEKDLKEINEAMAKLQIKSYPVQPSNVGYDFSEPRKVNEWINFMRSSTNMAGEKFARPAGYFGQIRHYRKNPKHTVQPKHEVFEFLVNSGDTRAVKTEDLNYLCYFSTGKKTYTLKAYSTVISWASDSRAEEKVKFARNVLRLIKGKSFMNPEKFLEGENQTIEASLEVVAILLTSESLRDPRCRYLAISEFYKLKKGKISIDDLFHPSKGRYIPARKAQADITEADKKFFSQEPTNPSRLSVKKEGGASQIRGLDSVKEIMPHFYDKEMQAIYKEKIKGMEDDVEHLKRGEEKEMEKIRLEYEAKFNEMEDQFRRKIKDIEDRYPGQTQEMSPALKQELEETQQSYKENKENEEGNLFEALETAISLETLVARHNLHKNSPFSKWCIAKFKKAHDLFEMIKIEPSDKVEKIIVPTKDV